MRVRKPGTDCEVDFTILANGKKCPEFVLPDPEDDASAPTCFISVPDDATITIQGSFSGSAILGRVDVLADGSFVANRIIDDEERREERKVKVLKFWDKRKLEVKSFLNVPDLTNRKNHRLRPRVVEGNLMTKRLSTVEAASPLHGGDEASGIGVGSITLVVSLSHDTDEVHPPGKPDDLPPYYPHVTLHSWREHVADVMDSGIKPEHELVMEVFRDSNPVADKKAVTFYRDQNAQRFGSQAWAYLVFYYRTQAAINAAGCVPLTESQALPSYEGTFITASDLATMAQEASESPSPAPTPSPPAPLPAPTMGTRKSLGIGQSLSLPSIRDPHAWTARGLIQNDDDGALAITENAESSKSNGKASSTSPDTPQSLLRPSQNSKRASTASKNRVSFSDPLTIGSTNNTSAAGSILAKTGSHNRVDDLASPSLPTLAPRPVISKSAATPSAPPTFQTPTKPTKDVSPSSSQTPSRKRNISQANANGSPSPGGSVPTSASPAKSPRLEEMAAKKARLVAELEAKRDRKATAQRKLDDEKRQREAQQRRWVVEEAQRREEEQRRKAAEDEEARKAEEDMAAEMEALERENELEDEAMARLAEEEEQSRVDWEEMVKAREQVEMEDA